MAPSPHDSDENRPPAAPAWTVTFADMMALLLCLFVLLFAMGRTENAKFRAMAASLEARFGRPKPPENVPELPPVAPAAPANEGPARPSNRPTNDRAAVAGVRRLSLLRAGSQPTLGTTLHFDETADELSPAACQLLHEAAEQLRGKANKIEIRGHASGRPPLPGDGYVDEWDLAFARCRRTMQRLVEREGIDPIRLRLNVAGKNEPLHLATDPQLLSENSRVEVFMLNEYAEDLLGTEAERAARVRAD